MEDQDMGWDDCQCWYAIVFEDMIDDGIYILWYEKRRMWGGGGGKFEFESHRSWQVGQKYLLGIHQTPTHNHPPNALWILNDLTNN